MNNTDVAVPCPTIFFPTISRTRYGFCSFVWFLREFTFMRYERTMYFPFFFKEDRLLRSVSGRLIIVDFGG